MSRIFSSGADSIYRRGRNIFIKGRIVTEEGERKKISPPPLKNFCSRNITVRGLADYLNITKERVVLASAPYAPHESFFYHTILNSIRGILKGGGGKYPDLFLLLRGKYPLCHTARHASNTDYKKQQIML